MQWLYLNGSLVRRDDEVALPASPSDDPTLIETFRSHEGRVFHLAQHFERLCSGAPVLGLTVPLTLRHLETAVADVLARNEAPDARLRLTVSAGPGLRTDVTLTATELTGYPPELYERGMHATIADVRRDETSALSRIKCAAGLRDGVLARERAREAGFDEAIMLNSRGSVAEATVSNLFVVYDGRLLTPKIEGGALPGITRAAVLDLARESGIEAAETEVTLDGLRASDEAFLTNSVMGVMPLTRLQGATIGDGDVGQLTEQLSQLYRDVVSAAA
jgi:branched-subunit amino acid aminotransferase/4-amino-4-deoxychorismate lyase